MSDGANEAKLNTELRSRDLWNCGNDHLCAQLVLLIVMENGVFDARAMSDLQMLADRAGPEFCERHIPFVRSCERVPF